MLCTCSPDYSACPQPSSCPLLVIFMVGHLQKSLKPFLILFLSNLPQICFETTWIQQLSFVNLLLWSWCICLSSQMQYLLIAPHYLLYVSMWKITLLQKLPPHWKVTWMEKKLTSSIFKSAMFSIWISVLQIFCLLNISLDSSVGCNAVTQLPPLIYLGSWFL